MRLPFGRLLGLLAIHLILRRGMVRFSRSPRSVSKYGGEAILLCRPVVPVFAVDDCEAWLAGLRSLCHSPSNLSSPLLGSGDGQVLGFGECAFILASELHCRFRETGWQLKSR